MLSNKEFFEQLREEEEYLNAMMSKDVYSGIELELRERMVVGDVRRKNKLFEQDEHHKQLVKNIAKAKIELLNYEYDLNHKKK